MFAQVARAVPSHIHKPLTQARTAAVAQLNVDVSGLQRHDPLASKILS